MDKKINYILVYGSLRKGAYNYDRFKAHYNDNLNYVDTLKIEGYDLYDLGIGYPGIKKNPYSEIPLTVDLLETSTTCFVQIDAMESYANYTPTQIEIELNGKKVICTMYIYNGGVTQKQQVMSGDWLNHLQTEN